MSKLSKALIAAAGNSGGAGLTVEDVFSTYLYTGTGAAQDIVNGIDLETEGGLVWIKDRDSGTRQHYLFDSEHLAAPYYNQYLNSNDTDALYTATGTGNGLGGLFNTDGFPVQGNHSSSGVDYASWSFRKAEKFFDVVTYTGTGSVKTVSHNLGSTPGLVIVKAVSSTSNWFVLHTGIGKFGYLDLTQPFTTATIEEYFGNDVSYVPPTDSVFTIGSNPNINVSGTTYVAYLFASDAGGFGDDGSESIIKCGSFTGNTTVDLGFEPAWIMIKPTSSAGNWDIHDVMRGWPSSGDAKRLKANLSEAETSTSQIYPNATGFSTLIGSASYIYIAIRRPMKTPESGTEVYTAVSASTNPYPTTVTSGFPVDMVIMGDQPTTWGYNWSVSDRLRGGSNVLFTSSTAAENTGSNTTLDSNTGLTNGWVSGGTTGLFQMFKRATGFFDVVAYDGTGVSPMNVTHNLGVTPELIITKARTGGDTYGWWTYPLFVPDAYGNTGKVKLNDNTAYGSTGWTGPMATSTAITVPSTLFSNKSGEKYVAYLFASLDGISKLGMYTGNGTSQTIDCGFAAGARFILIKRTDSTGDWYVWDSTRGIVAGNDPHLSLNSTAAEVTTDDSIDPASSGFIVNQVSATNINVSSASYIYLSIA